MNEIPDWPFDQARNVAAITTRQVLEEGYPILIVVHFEDDHSWAFVCGSTNETSDGRVIGMGTAMSIDPSIAEVAHIPPGYRAHRTAPDQPWEVRQDET